MIKLPDKLHLAGTKESFGLQVFQTKDGTTIPLDLTGFRVVIAVVLKSSPNPYTRDSNKQGQLKIVGDPKDGRIKFYIDAGDLLVPADLGQVLTYQLVLDAPGSNNGPRGAYPVGSGSFTNTGRVI